VEELLSKLKLLLPDESNDTLLLYFLEIAKSKILEKLYPFDSTKTELPSRYETKAVEIAVYLYNKQGAEGEITHNENGMNRTYESADVPPSMLRGIVPFVGSPFGISK
jgi:hypothetical protein